MPGKPRAVVAAGIAQRPGYGGHAWALLAWVVGLQRLGWDVLLVDRLDGGMGDEAANLRWFRDVVSTAGVERAAVLHPGGRVSGSSRAAVLDHVRTSDFVLNVMGFLDDGELLALARRLVFLDIDPGFGQFWCDLGLHDPFAGHDAFLTVGLNVGGPGCTVPLCGREWTPTLPPVVVDQWPEASGAGRAWTSVGSWRGPNGPIVHGGRTYGLRVHEFRRLIDLPRRVAPQMQVALDIDAADAADRDRLVEEGWDLVEPAVAAGTMDAYQRFVSGSRGELLIAKQLYVDTRGGWVSDRSACYLASGRPVIVQETGVRELLPTGDGLLVFGDVDEAVAAIEEVEGAYDHHRKAARGLACDLFDAPGVIGRLLDRGALA